MRIGARVRSQNFSGGIHSNVVYGRDDSSSAGGGNRQVGFFFAEWTDIHMCTNTHTSHDVGSGLASPADTKARQKYENTIKLQHMKSEAQKAHSEHRAAHLQGPDTHMLTSLVGQRN